MKFTFLFLLVLSAGIAGAQEFPKKFLGHWEGTLQWFQAGNKEPQKVKMQLVVKPADTAGHYTWQIVYGDKGGDNRPYVLKPVDTAKGHWAVDERNGIVLDHYWIGGRLTGTFTVQNTTINNSYWLEGDTLVAEFYSTGAKPVSTTGEGTEESPTVYSYTTKSYQRAMLKKQGDKEVKIRKNGL